jgi:hypothetical protein
LSQNIQYGVLSELDSPPGIDGFPTAQSAHSVDENARAVSGVVPVLD